MKMKKLGKDTTVLCTIELTCIEYIIYITPPFNYLTIQNLNSVFQSSVVLEDTNRTGHSTNSYFLQLSK